MKRLILLLLLVPLTLSAQKRLALVIGNGDYEGTDGDLRNSVNDAKAMAKALRECGFIVIEKYNLNLADMKKAIRDEFGVQLKGKQTALFYYSGHGIRHKSASNSAELTNYFIPTDFSANASAKDLQSEAIQMSMIVGQMEKAGTIQNILLLDACRSYPPAKGWYKSGTKAPILGSSKDIEASNPQQEFFIGYATEEGAEAQEGTDNISPFTAAFVAQMAKQGLDIQEIFRETRKAVIAKYPEQKPYSENKFNNIFYFRPPNNIEEKYKQALSNARYYRNLASAAEKNKDCLTEKKNWELAKPYYQECLKYKPDDVIGTQGITLCNTEIQALDCEPEKKEVRTEAQLPNLLHKSYTPKIEIGIRLNPIISTASYLDTTKQKASGYKARFAFLPAVELDYYLAHRLAVLSGIGLKTYGFNYENGSTSYSQKITTLEIPLGLKFRSAIIGSESNDLRAHLLMGGNLNINLSNKRTTNNVTTVASMPLMDLGLWGSLGVRWWGRWDVGFRYNRGLIDQEKNNGAAHLNVSYWGLDVGYFF